MVQAAGVFAGGESRRGFGTGKWLEAVMASSFETVYRKDARIQKPFESYGRQESKRFSFRVLNSSICEFLYIFLD